MLTHDEIALLNCVALGHSHKAAMKILDIPKGTFYNRHGSVFRKLGAASSIQAIRIALKQGYRIGGLRLEDSRDIEI